MIKFAAFFLVALLFLAPSLGSVERSSFRPLSARENVINVAVQEGVPVRHLLAIWGVESAQSLHLHIPGRSGEVGGFQIMPGTARWFECGDFTRTITSQARCATKVYKFARVRCGNSFMRNVRYYNRPGNGCGWTKKPNRHQMRAIAWLDIERRRTVREIRGVKS